MKRHSVMTGFAGIARYARTIATLGTLAIFAGAATFAHAQFRAIPNYVGIGAGLQFRNDINNHLSGVAPIAPRIVSLSFGQLPTEREGQEYWCSDCQQTNPCQGVGHGALALGSQGQWSCTSGATMANGFPLGIDVSAGAHRIQSLAPNSTTGDALSQGQSHLNDLTTASANYNMGANRLQNLGSGAASGDALSYGQTGAILNGLNLNSNPLGGLSPATANGQALTFAQSSAQLTTNQATGVFVSKADNSVSGTSIVITAPANIIAGNILVEVANWTSSTGTFTWPAGFTQIRSDSTALGNGLTVGWACKVATGGEPANYTTTFSVSAFTTAAIVQIKGATCTSEGSSVGVANATSATAAGFATTLTSDYVLTQGSYYGGVPLTPTVGQLLVNQSSHGTAVSGYTNPAGLTPSVTYSETINGNQSFLVSQVAFAASGTIQSLPLISGQQGANLQSLTTSVNNVLNVMAPPYNARSDGTTDDNPGIQQAIYDCEGATPPTFPATNGCTVYLPRALSGKCYAISKPLRVASGPIEIKGDSGSCIQKFYAGPTIISENWNTNRLTYGPALVGAGASLSTVGCIGNSCGFGNLDLAQYLNTSRVNLATAFATGFDIEFWMEPTVASAGGVLESIPSLPGTGNGMFALSFNGTQLSAQVTTTGGLVTLAACPAQTLSTAYDIALDWDHTTYRLFQAGTLCSSVASSNAPVLGPFEAMMLPDRGKFDAWMAGGVSNSPFQGYLDQVRFYSGSLHTAAYTPPTARFPITGDSKIQLMLNWDTSLDGTQLGYAIGNPVYLPVLGGASATVTNTLHLHDLELCGIYGQAGDGYFAQWSVNSEIDHVKCSNAVFAGLNFYNNDYGNYEHDNIVSGGMLGILHGAAWNGSLAQNDNMDVQQIACEETVGDGGGGFQDIHQGCLNRGGLYYCKMYMSVGFASHVDFDGCDQEAGDPNFVASILLYNPTAPILFTSPDLSGVLGKPFIEHDGGGMGSTIISGQFQQGAGASRIINYAISPSSPTVFINSLLPAGVPLSNQAGNPNVLALGIGPNSVLQSLELQQVPAFDLGLNHVIVNAIPDPAAPALTVVGTTGASAYGPYFVVCHDVNGGVTNVSPASNTIANGPSTLSGTNYIRINWIANSACGAWDVLKGNTTTALTAGVAGSAASFNDIGQTTAAYTAPGRNNTGDIAYGSMLVSAGMPFSKLPGTVVNGGRFYCSDCDPPANPPVTCTHSGARTGSWVDGLNNQWLCVP